MSDGSRKAEEWLLILKDFADELPASEEEEFWRAFSRGINKQFYARWGEAKAKRKAAQREAAERERQERLEALRNGSWDGLMLSQAEAYERSADNIRERNRILWDRIRNQERIRVAPTIRAAVRETEHGFRLVEGAPVYIDGVQAGTIQGGAWEGTVALPPLGCDCDANSSSPTEDRGRADTPPVPAGSSSGNPRA